MPVTQSFLDFISDELAVVGPIRIKRMFGAAGIYCGDFFFAVADDDTLYFKVDDVTRPDFQREGMGPFRPYGVDGVAMNGYYQVPAGVLEDRDRLHEWALRAIEVAQATKSANPKRNQR